MSTADPVRTQGPVSRTYLDGFQWLSVDSGCPRRWLSSSVSWDSDHVPGRRRPRAATWTDSHPRTDRHLAAASRRVATRVPASCGALGGIGPAGPTPRRMPAGWSGPSAGAPLPGDQSTVLGLSRMWRGHAPGGATRPAGPRARRGHAPGGATRPAGPRARRGHAPGGATRPADGRSSAWGSRPRQSRPDPDPHQPIGASPSWPGACDRPSRRQRVEPPAGPQRSPGPRPSPRPMDGSRPAGP